MHDPDLNKNLDPDPSHCLQVKTHNINYMVWCSIAVLLQACPTGIRTHAGPWMMKGGLQASVIYCMCLGAGHTFKYFWYIVFHTSRDGVAGHTITAAEVLPSGQIY